VPIVPRQPASNCNRNPVQHSGEVLVLLALAHTACHGRVELTHGRNIPLELVTGTGAAHTGLAAAISCTLLSTLEMVRHKRAYPVRGVETVHVSERSLIPECPNGDLADMLMLGLRSVMAFITQQFKDESVVAALKSVKKNFDFGPHGHVTNVEFEPATQNGRQVVELTVKFGLDDAEFAALMKELKAH
jgi:hypothetical protein